MLKLCETKCGDYLISNNKALLSLEKVHAFLSESYWANTLTKDIIHKSINNSECFGIYLGDQQVGFARIVTDYSVMYWLCDVYIDKLHRKKGLGNKLIEAIVHHEELKDLTGILTTRDAHALYEKYGFVKDTDRFMRKNKVQ